MNAVLAARAAPTSGLRQTVTPQLAQCIRFLQLDTPALLAEVAQALTQNVMLVRDDDTGNGDDADPADADDAPGDDRDWDEYLSDLRSGYTPEREPEHAAAPPGLQVRLLRALGEETLAPGIKAAACAILEAVDEAGRLDTPLEKLAERHGLPIAALLQGLAALRSLAPAGYAARSVRECLHLQLEAQAPSPARDDALTILDAGLLDVNHFDPDGLRLRLGFEPTRFAQALERLRVLDFHPGAEDDDPRPIVPDVIVTRHGGRWRVDLHPALRPRIGINRQFERLLAASRDHHTALQGQLQDARSLLRGIAMRNDTLLRTAHAILRHQFRFLSCGDAALRPLKLREIADAIGMHESTVSRVTTGKYMQTPRGVFELRHFFTVALRGDEVSAARAKARLRTLIGQEPPAAPLSDAQLAGALAREGIQVVRRTVAKYRQAMSIPPAPLRHLTALNVVKIKRT